MATLKAHERRESSHPFRKLVSEALTEAPYDRQPIERLEAQIDSLLNKRAEAKEARAMFGLTRGENIQHKSVVQRIAERPGDSGWEIEAWAAFWAIQGEPTAKDLRQLRSQLTQARRSIADQESARAKRERVARSSAWPEDWPWEGHEIWMKETGTIRSAQAWAAAGFTFEEALLGDPDTDFSRDELRTRVRNEEPKR